MSRNVIQNNIDNLTTLWILASEKFNGFKINFNNNIAEITDSEWPNRIWNKNIFEDYDDLNNLRNLIKENNPELIYTKWYEKTDVLIDESQVLGLRLSSNQIGMSMKMSDYIISNVSEFIKLSEINNDVDINLWSSIFSQCFGYTIPFHVIQALKNKVKYFLIFDNNNLIGCVSTFKKNNEIGIHSLGILKEFRKNGSAEKVMHLLLSDAKNSGINYAHLQASLMGLSIYTKIGFKAVFQIVNYKLTL